jgi:hypothetical protein
MTENITSTKPVKPTKKARTLKAMSTLKNHPSNAILIIK